MLKINKYIYVHFLTIAAAVTFVLNGHIKEFALTYAVMLVHECAHLAAALGIGLKVSHIGLYPFGVNLKLKNKLTASLTDDVILYGAGAAVNGVMASVAVISGIRANEYGEYFYRMNIALMAVNLLPVMPLDGGCIAKRVFAYYIGERTAAKIMKSITVILGVGLTILGIYELKRTGYNYSLLIMAVFIIGNIFTQRAKYSTEYMRELMFYKSKSRKRARVIIANEGEDNRKTAKRFIPCAYSIVCVTDDMGRIRKWESETEIVEKIVGENRAKY